MQGAAESRAGQGAVSTVTDAGMRIVRLLVGSAPLTVNEMIEAVGVSRTAIMEQLHELVSAGFVERTREKLAGRGRPHCLYRATQAALAVLFVNHQRMVMPAIWEAIAQVGGPDLTQKVREHVSNSLAEQYRRRLRGDTPEERLRDMVRMLNEEGGIVEVESDAQGHLVMRRRSCPYISMFEDSRAICSVDLAMLGEVVGAPVRQVACRHDGAPCCAFEVSLRNGK